MSKRTVTLDVREDINNGCEPLAKIMQVISRLRKNEDLRLIAPFEPVPLFPIMVGKGFSHRAKAMPQGDWEVLFTRSSEEKPISESAFPSPAACKIIEVDARGLEPPQPLVKILEALPQISDATELKARTDRRPIHLYAHLDERGYVGRTEEQPDGSFATYIHCCKKQADERS